MRIEGLIYAGVGMTDPNGVASCLLHGQFRAPDGRRLELLDRNP